MKICNVCKIEKSLDCYHKRGKGSSPAYACKDCKKIIDKRNYNSNKKEKILEYKSHLKQIRDSKKSAGCLYCGEKDLYCLDFHHLDPTIKENHVGRIMSIPLLYIEIDKCVVVCSNCHRKLHGGRILAPLV